MVLFAIEPALPQKSGSHLDRVSTGSGSDLNSDQHAIVLTILDSHRRPGRYAIYERAPQDVSLELFKDFKLASEGEPYENVLCWHGRASRNDRDCRT